MTITEITKIGKVRADVAESLYWHCIWLRGLSPKAKVNWTMLLLDEHYRKSPYRGY